MVSEIKKPPLTSEERREKEALKRLVKQHKTAWEYTHGEKFTYAVMGREVGRMIRGSPVTPGAMWQYLAVDQDTRLNEQVVGALAFILGFDPSAVGKRFARKAWQGGSDLDSQSSRLLYLFGQLSALNREHLLRVAESLVGLP